METKWIQLDTLTPAQYELALREAAVLLQNGELVAFPTETVYGLGGNALDPAAASKIYAVKGRPVDNPLIVHVSHIDMVEPLVTTMTPLFRRLAYEFWPGPLTMILPKSETVPSATTGGLATVALRMPAHPVALDMIDKANLPVAAPSANLSGKPSTTRGDHVYHDLQGKIPLLLDGGAAEVGLESTIVDLSGRQPAILRPGKITFEELKPLIPTLSEPALMPAAERPLAPGMKYRHYAPAGAVRLLPRDEREWRNLADVMARGEGPLAVIATAETCQRLHNQLTPDLLLAVGTEGDLDSVGHRLFDALRSCDAQAMRLIYIEEFTECGFGAALMNRIRKALSHH